VKLLQVIGCITTGLDPTRKTFAILKNTSPLKKLPYLQRILFQKRFGILWIKSNEITFTVSKDTLIEVESYKIGLQHLKCPYEGHYIHRDTKLVSKMEKLASPGDYVVETRQKKEKFRNFRTQGIDSFQLEFFDTMLQKNTQAMF
jgi:hypothetical protein